MDLGGDPRGGKYLYLGLIVINYVGCYSIDDSIKAVTNVCIDGKVLWYL